MSIKFISSLDLLIWDVKSHFKSDNVFNNEFPIVLFGSFLSKGEIAKVQIQDNNTYKILGVRSYGKGVYLNRIVNGKTLKMKTYQIAKKNHLFWCKVDTKNGAFGIIKEDLKDGIASSNMAFAKIDTKKVHITYLQILFKSKKINEYMDTYVTGTTNRKYIRPNQLLSEIKIPLPSIEEQNTILEKYNTKILLSDKQEKEAREIEESIEKYLFDKLGIEKKKEKKKKKGLYFIENKKVYEWGVDKILNKLNFLSLEYETTSLLQNENLYINLFRGKSPVYKIDSQKVILNQKCNRWNEIQVEYVKTVDEDWLKKVDNLFLTKENDILINSTGEGTIGRASNIYKKDIGYLYDSHLLLLRVNSKLINSEFFVYLFNSSYGQMQVNNIKSAQATKQTELGVNNLKKILFPLPILDFQNKIASEISKRKDEVKRLKEEAIKNRQDAIKEFEEGIFIV